MAKKDPKEYGKKFLDDLVNSFPEADREAVKAQLTKMPEAELQKVGEHVLRQEDYSESMNAVQTLRNTTEQWRKDLSTWHTAVQAEIAEGAAAKERLKAMGERRPTISGAPDPDPDTDTNPGGNGHAPVIDMSGFVKVDDAKKMVQDAVLQATNYATNYGAYIASLAVSHSKEFDGELLDTSALIAFCREHNVQLDRGGYDQYVHEKREVNTKKVHDDELKAAEDRGRRLALSESSSALPFTPPDGSGDNQTLSGLGKDKADRSGAVDRAVATYHAETRKRLGSAG